MPVGVPVPMIYIGNSWSVVNNTIPGTMMLAESVDGFGLATEHLYSPPVVILFSLCMYLAGEVLTSKISVPSVTGSESLVQITVVAGPPVEIQTRVNWGLAPSTVNVSIEMAPAIMSISQCLTILPSTYLFHYCIVQHAQFVYFHLHSMRCTDIYPLLQDQ